MARKPIQQMTLNKNKGILDVMFSDGSKKEIPINDLGGYVDPEDIAEAVEEYLEEHPVEPYDDTEVKADINSLGGRLTNAESDIEELKETAGLIEPGKDDLPILYVSGTLPTSKDDGALPVKIKYKSKTLEFSEDATFKVQGDSSTLYPKKNFTIKFKKTDGTKSKHKFKNWNEYSEFVIKANYTEITHSRNVCSAKIWGAIVGTRENYDELPIELKESSNNGAIDGFPVLMYVDGVYYGRYSFNLSKGDMLDMDEDNPNHAMVQGQASRDNVTTFRVDSTTAEAGKWTDELTDDITHVLTRWNQILYFVNNSTDADFKAGIDNYIDLQSLIDYYCFGYFALAYDSFAKNQSYLTYDGQKFYASFYDMDGTFGGFWDGTMPLTATNNLMPHVVYKTDSYTLYDEGNLLFLKLYFNFHDEIVERWNELRSFGMPLSFDYVDSVFEEWFKICPVELMKKDYASTTAGGAFTGMNNVDGGNADTNTKEKLIGIIHDRAVMIDSFLNGNNLFNYAFPSWGAYMNRDTFNSGQKIEYTTSSATRTYRQIPITKAGTYLLTVEGSTISALFTMCLANYKERFETELDSYNTVSGETVTKEITFDRKCLLFIGIPASATKVSLVLQETSS